MFLVLFTLQTLFNEDGFAGKGVLFGKVHDTGISGGCGREDLNLFGQYF
jgi:hypothetical protein